jgi:hypothetical protein
MQVIGYSLCCFHIQIEKERILPIPHLLHIQPIGLRTQEFGSDKDSASCHIQSNPFSQRQQYHYRLRFGRTCKLILRFQRCVWLLATPLWGERVGLADECLDQDICISINPMEFVLSRKDDYICVSRNSKWHGPWTMVSSIQSSKTLDLFSTRSDWDVDVKTWWMCDGLTIVYRVMHRTWMTEVPI